MEDTIYVCSECGSILQKIESDSGEYYFECADCGLTIWSDSDLEESNFQEVEENNGFLYMELEQQYISEYEEEEE